MSPRHPHENLASDFPHLLPKASPHKLASLVLLKRKRKQQSCAQRERLRRHVGKRALLRRGGGVSEPRSGHLLASVETEDANVWAITSWWQEAEELKVVCPLRTLS